MQAAGAGLPPVHPIDHGYAWLIALGGFGLNFFVSGGMRSTGLLFIEVIDLYKADKGLTSLTMGLLAFGFAVFSAIGNAVGVMSTMRRATLIGAGFMFCGALFTSMAGNVMTIILSLGFLSGVGYGFAYGPSMVIIGQYFQRRRALATGLATAGGSVGTLVLPMFFSYAIKNYGFHGAMLIYAGLTLHAIPAAMLLRPITFYDVKRRGKTALLTAAPNVAPPSDTNNNASQASDSRQATVQRREGVDRVTRYQLVGSRLYPAISHASLFDSDELLAAAAEEAAATNGATQGTGNGSGQTSAAAPPPPRITVGVAVRLFVRRLFDRDLLHSATFILFVSALSLGQGGFVDACFFVPPFAVERWRSKKLASMLIMLLGIADFVGRLSGGWFADLGLVRRHLIMAVSFFVAGLSIFLVTFFRSFMLMATATIVLSGFGGCYLALVAVILADLFGLHKLPPSIGLNSLAMGLATLPLPPILGSLQKVAGTFAISLQLSGLLMVTAGIMLFFIPKMQRRDARKNQQTTGDRTTTAATSAAQDPGETKC